MLLQFSVTNHRSIKDTAIISLKASINTNHAQLIFTTHDTGLLDLTLLRRDQIWFAEKDEKTMQTDIYALTEFSPRKGENISKGYLQGRYAKNSSSRI